MRVTKYRLELDDNLKAILVKDSCKNYPMEKLNIPENIVKMLNELYGLNRLAEEHVFMVALNNKCKPLGVFEVSHGTVNSCPCVSREIYIRAVLCGATSVILAHNHTSQDVTPSKADLEVCKNVAEAGKLMGIQLIDNIIIGGNSYVSFHEKGLY